MVQKNRHLRTIAQFCRAVSSQLRHVSTIGKKKLVKQQYLLQMSLQYGEIRPTSGEIDSLVWGTPANFNGFRVLAALLHGTLLVGVSQTVSLNRGRHPYSVGRPSRWALAHISSSFYHTLFTAAHSMGRPLYYFAAVVSIFLSSFFFLFLMVALRSRCGHYIFVLWFLLLPIFYLLFSSPNLSGRRLDVYHTSTHGVALV